MRRGALFITVLNDAYKNIVENNNKKRR